MSYTPTRKEIRAAEQQVIADFEEAMKAFELSKTDEAPFKMYCLGVVMCTLTLKDFVEKPERRPLPDMEAEQAMESYYEAARGQLRAD